jgi:predicted aconitase with swiveling domain
VLAEAIRLQTAPVAALTATPDAVFVVAAIVAQELYGRQMPVLVLDPPAYASPHTGDHVTIRRDGQILIGH